MLVEALEGPLGVIGAAFAVTAAVILSVGLWQRYATRRDLRALSAVATVSPNDRLFTAVLTARSRFTESVRHYERAIQAPAQVNVKEHAGGTIGESVEDGATVDTWDDTMLDRLAQEKVDAREDLIEAQRIWEEAKPPTQPDSALALWSGAGIMRAWNLGPVGLESVLVRVDHSIDASCWATWQLKRMRFGFAVGAERQQLAMFVFGADCSSLPGLLSRGFGGAEVALRPGFVPTRTWRRKRRDEVSKRSVDAVLSRARTEEMIRPQAKAVTEAVAAGYGYELGRPLSEIDRLPTDDSMLAIHTKGPSLLAGVWGGRDPRATLVASSPHQAWQHNS